MLNRYETGSILVAEKTVINIRVDASMKDELKAMADEQQRTTHNMIIFLLRTAIEQWKLTKPA